MNDSKIGFGVKPVEGTEDEVTTDETTKFDDFNTMSFVWTCNYVINSYIMVER